MSFLNSKKNISGLFVISILLIAGCGSANDAQTSAGTTVTTGPSKPNGYYMSMTVNPAAIQTANDVSAVVFVFSDAALTKPVTTGVNVRIVGVTIVTGITGEAAGKVTVTGAIGQLFTIDADVDASNGTISIPVTIIP